LIQRRFSIGSFCVEFLSRTQIASWLRLIFIMRQMNFLLRSSQAYPAAATLTLPRLPALTDFFWIDVNFLPQKTRTTCNIGVLDCSKIRISLTMFGGYPVNFGQGIRVNLTTIVEQSDFFLLERHVANSIFHPVHTFGRG
jgi:hypothetical protein